MDGITFFWFLWMIWVYVVFLMEKSALRTELSFWLLLVIIASSYHFEVYGEEINFATVILLIYGYYHIGRMPFKYFFYTIFGCGVISIAYACFYMFAIYDPVWVLFNFKWMLTVSMVLLTFLCFQDSKLRFVALAVGLCHGEILYTLVTLRLNPTKTIGDFYFLDIFANSIFLCASWYFLQQSTERWHQHFQKTLQEKKQVL